MRRAALLIVAGALAAAGCGGGDKRPSREEEAERYEPAARRFARTHDGAVEPHGTLTLFWVYGHRHPLAEPTRDCLL